MIELEIECVFVKKSSAITIVVTIIYGSNTVLNLLMKNDPSIPFLKYDLVKPKPEIIKKIDTPCAPEYFSDGKLINPEHRCPKTTNIIANPFSCSDDLWSSVGASFTLPFTLRKERIINRIKPKNAISVVVSMSSISPSV